MTNTELKSKIEAFAKDLTFSGEEADFLCVEIPKETLKDFMTKMRDNLGFDYLYALTGMDFGENLGVTYHLESTQRRDMVQITTKTSDRENPTFDSLLDIYPAVLYYEMEAFDLFGFKFTGHPNLKRLFMPEDWVGSPMRKDYIDEVNMLIR